MNLLAIKVMSLNSWPSNIDKAQTKSWPFVYLHGAARVEGIQEAPDLCLFDREMSTVRDGIHIATLLTEKENYDAYVLLWTVSDHYYDGTNFISNHIQRKGLVVLSDCYHDWIVAQYHFINKSHTI